MEKKIEEWKKQYGKVFKSIISGEEYIWRTLKRKEYTSILSETLKKFGEDADPELIIDEDEASFCKTCLLSPENVEEVIEEVAGLSRTLSMEIMKKAGFKVEKTEEL